MTLKRCSPLARNWSSTYFAGALSPLRTACMYRAATWRSMSSLAAADIKRDGAKAGHSIDAVKRARSKHRIKFVSYGKPRRTRWEIPGTQLEQPQSVQPSGESALTALTALTVETRAVQ